MSIHISRLLSAGGKNSIRRQRLCMKQDLGIDPDGIDPMIAKKSIGQVAMVVSDIINASFDKGIVP